MSKNKNLPRDPNIEKAFEQAKIPQKELQWEINKKATEHKKGPLDLLGAWFQELGKGDD